jgi:DNA topoisomerase-3
MLFLKLLEEPKKRFHCFEDPKSKEKEADILPSFVVGEKGPHQPSFFEKKRNHPTIY